jgi:hypothetical protein
MDADAAAQAAEPRIRTGTGPNPGSAQSKTQLRHDHTQVPTVAVQTFFSFQISCRRSPRRRLSASVIMYFQPSLFQLLAPTRPSQTSFNALALLASTSQRHLPRPSGPNCAADSLAPLSDTHRSRRQLYHRPLPVGPRARRPAAPAPTRGLTAARARGARSAHATSRTAGDRLLECGGWRRRRAAPRSPLLHRRVQSPSRVSLVRARAPKQRRPAWTRCRHPRAPIARLVGQEPEQSCLGNMPPASLDLPIQSSPLTV